MKTLELARQIAQRRANQHRQPHVILYDPRHHDWRVRPVGYRWPEDWDDLEVVNPNGTGAVVPQEKRGAAT